MATYEITAEMNLKKIIAESREVAQALNEFADNLEQIEKKYAEPITACGRYKKSHTVEDTYTKEEVIDMFNDLKSEIEKIAE